MDSGASYPVTPNKRLFTSYKPSVGVVKMRNKQKSKVVGVVDGSLVTNMDHKLMLKMVRYVQDLRMNLMLGSEVDSKGYTSHFVNDSWKFPKKIFLWQGEKNIATPPELWLDVPRVVWLLLLMVPLKSMVSMGKSHKIKEKGKNIIL